MNSKEFVNIMKQYASSPSTKLVGDLKGGFVYDEDHDPKYAYLIKENADLQSRLYDALYNKKAVAIKNVIFNNPVTVVIWSDDTKTIVRAQGDEPYDREKGLAMAIVKRVYGNKGNYYNQLKKWLKDSD